MPRIHLIREKQDVAPETYALFDDLAALRGRISGPSSVVMHSPGLARPWNEISEFLHRDSIVEPQYAELAVCATAREFDCAYVWAAHVTQARTAGISEATLDVVRERRSLDGLPEEQWTLLTYVRQIIVDNRVEPAVFEALLKAHNPRWLVELTAWIGRYGALACILNSFEVEPAPDAERLPSRELPALKTATARPPESSPRITPITSRDQVAAADLPVFEAVAEGRGSVRGPWSLLMHSPPLCNRVLDISTYLRSSANLPPLLRELTTVATAREKDCSYVWAAHAGAARNEGVDAATVETIRQRGSLDMLPDGDAAVVDYVRQIMRTHRVSQDVFDKLRAEHGTAGLVELTCVIGHYNFVSNLLNACEFAPAPDAERLEG